MSIEDLLDKAIQAISHKNIVNNYKFGLMSHACHKVKNYFYKIPKENDSIELNSLLTNNVKQHLITLKKETCHEVVLVKLQEIIFSLNKNNISEKQEAADRLSNILESLVSKIKNEIYLYEIVNMLNGKNENIKSSNIINLSEEEKHDLINNIECYVSTRLDLKDEQYQSFEKIVERINNTLSLAEILNKIVLEKNLNADLLKLNQQLHNFKTLKIDNILCNTNTSVQMPSFH